jgi:hypothetical protein
MAQFTDIIKSQRQSGKSVMGSLSSAIGQKSLEKIDPRNYLFNRKGVMAALFPGLKGYQAKSAQDITKFGSSSGGMSSVQVEEMSGKLDSISGDLKIVAKNSVVLPHLARDMNVVRQNIIKLVKLKGGKSSNRADMFFLRAKERESAYEAQVDKATPVGKKEAKQKDKKEEGIFSKIGDFLAKFTLGNVLGWLLQGAAIITIFNFIGKLILEKDFREAVWQKFDEIMRKFGTTGEDVIKNVATALGVVGGIMLAFQVAVNLAIAGIKAAYMKMMTKGGVPAGAPGGKGGKKVPSKTPSKGRFGVLGVLGTGLFAAEGASAMTSPSVPSRTSPSTLPSHTLGGNNSMSPLSSGGTVATTPSNVSLDTTSPGSYPTYSPAMQKQGQLKNVAGAVIHHTGGESISGAISTLKQRGLSYHYLIDKEGKVTQLLPDGAVGFHTLPGAGGLSNANTIGISLAAKDDRDVTPAQIESAKQLNAKLAAKYGYKETNVWGHGEVNPGHKSATEGAQVVTAIRSGTSPNVALASNENNKGKSALVLGSNIRPNPTGQTTINNDNRTTNITNSEGGDKSKSADPSDQLFKMLFMSVA